MPVFKVQQERQHSRTGRRSGEEELEVRESHPWHQVMEDLVGYFKDVGFNSDREEK